MSWRPTLAQEWMVIVVTAAVAAVSVVLNRIESKADFYSERITFWSIVGQVVVLGGHVFWISMDLRRRGRETGWWRFAAFFCGPFAIWLYLVLEYRLRAFLWIPLSLGVYLVAYFGPALVILVVDGVPVPAR